MTFQEQLYRDAFSEFKDAGFSDADADIGAREAAKKRSVETELATKGGFIGDPQRPESNVFDPMATPNRASGGVMLAGTGGALPSVNYDTLRELQSQYGDDTAGAIYEKPIEAGRSALALVDAAPGDVPPAERAALEQELSQAIPRVAQLVNAGTEIEDALGTLRPTLERAGTMARQYRFQPQTPEQLSKLEWQQLADARQRLRAAESDLIDPMKSLNKIALEKQVGDARSIIRRLESKAMGGATNPIPVGGGNPLKIGRFTVIPE